MERFYAWLYPDFRPAEAVSGCLSENEHSPTSTVLNENLVQNVSEAGGFEAPSTGSAVLETKACLALTRHEEDSKEYPEFCNHTELVEPIHFIGDSNDIANEHTPSVNCSLDLLDDEPTYANIAEVQQLKSTKSLSKAKKFCASNKLSGALECNPRRLVSSRPAPPIPSTKNKCLKKKAPLPPAVDTSPLVSDPPPCLPSAAAFPNTPDTKKNMYSTPTKARTTSSPSRVSITPQIPRLAPSHGGVSPVGLKVSQYRKNVLQHQQVPTGPVRSKSDASCDREVDKRRLVKQLSHPVSPPLTPVYEDVELARSGSVTDHELAAYYARVYLSRACTDVVPYRGRTVATDAANTRRSSLPSTPHKASPLSSADLGSGDTPPDSLGLAGCTRLARSDSVDTVAHMHEHLFALSSRFSVTLTNLSACVLVVALLLPNTAGLLYTCFRLVFGTLFPAYYSYKAVKTKNVKEYVKWMMYWIVFAFFTCAETFTDMFLAFWFPFYYELKIMLVLWLLSPATRGASLLYRKFVHPWLTQREGEIDDAIERAKEQGYSAVLTLGTRGVNYATSVIMTTAIKGGGGLVNQLKRSYSVGELREVGDDVGDYAGDDHPRTAPSHQPSASSVRFEQGEEQEGPGLCIPDDYLSSPFTGCIEPQGTQIAPVSRGSSSSCSFSSSFASGPSSISFLDDGSLDFDNEKRLASESSGIRVRTDVFSEPSAIFALGEASGKVEAMDTSIQEECQSSEDEGSDYEDFVAKLPPVRVNKRTTRMQTRQTARKRIN